MSDKNINIVQPGLTGNYKGTGLILRYSHAPRSKTAACKEGISCDDFVRILNEWDESLSCEPVDSNAMPKPVPKMEFKDYISRITPATELTEDYKILALEKESGSTWVKFVVYNTKTRRYIFRSATAETPERGKTASECFGKCVDSHAEGWVVNITNMWTDQTFWLRLKRFVNTNGLYY